MGARRESSRACEPIPPGAVRPAFKKIEPRSEKDMDGLEFLAATIEQGMKGLPADGWACSLEEDRSTKSVKVTFNDPLRKDGQFDVTLPQGADQQKVKNAVRTAFRKYLRSHPVTKGTVKPRRKH
jgi:hypothetical protein